MAELLERIASDLAGRYRLERELGRGGMAIVYLAHDLRHDRQVALKVLTPELATALGPGRFLHEIAVAARLTHPHVLPLLDSGESCGLPWYTMPFVEGETLRGRLARERQLPLEEALRIAREVGDALDHAHRQGVVHRDVKPENVMFAAGHAVLADFGIAGALEASGSDRLTATGVILGTPDYLSPEQAMGGRAADGRADQYALACVLYEMLAGQPPFSGPTTESLIHQHLNVVPRPVTELRPAVPPALAAALSRALAKNPADRFPDARAFRDALVPPSPPVPALAGAPPRPRRARAVLRAAAALASVLAVLLAWAAWQRLHPAGGSLRALRRLTFDTGATFDPAVSPDGKMVAYCSDRDAGGPSDLWVQYTNGRSAPLRLTRGERVQQPAFSPDGSLIAFVSSRDGGGVDVVSTLGGTPRRVAPHGLRPRFSPDGTRISYLEMLPYAPNGRARMFIVPVEGGTPVPFRPDFVTFTMPGGGPLLWSPDGRWLLFQGRKADGSGPLDWWVAPFDGGPAVATGALPLVRSTGEPQLPCAWLRDHVVFARGPTLEGMNLFRVPIHAKPWRVSGPVEQLTEGPGLKYHLGIADDGTAVFADLTWELQVYSLALDPRTGLANGPAAPLTADITPKFGVAIARDGSRFAYSTFRNLSPWRVEEHLVDPATGTDSTALSLPLMLIDLGGLVAPRGEAFVYQVPDSSGNSIHIVHRGNGTRTQHWAGRRALAYFPSGAILARDGTNRLVRLDPASGATRELLRLRAGNVLEADVSGERGHLVVLVGSPEGTLTMYTVRLRGTVAGDADLVPLVAEPGWCSSPRWSTGGARVYFLSDRDGSECIWSVRVDAATGGPAGAVEPVMHAHHSRCCFYGPRGVWNLGVGGDRIVFNAAQIRSNIWTTKFEPR
jgi:Tol biopolymer transport system component